MSHSRLRGNSAGAALGAALLVLCACLFLFTQANRFPFFYHPDEPDKVEQVITGKWNFHHPLLMLASAKLATELLHTGHDSQAVVVVGRYASAVFASIAVVGFALLGYLRRGPMGFLTVALLLGLHHQLFELAHYFKEDTALLMGMGLSFLAIGLYWEKQSVPRLLFLGVTCGLSVSAKYLGVVMIIPALITLHFAPSTGRKSAIYLQFLGIFVATTAVANFPLLANLDTFRNSFHREVTLVRANEGSQRFPLFEYLKIFVSNTNPAIWVFLAVHFFRQWKERESQRVLDWILSLFPILFMAVLSCSHKTNDRYFLPATALFSVLAALGACDLAEGLGRKIGRPLAVGSLLGLICIFQVFQIPWINSHSLAEYYQAFQHDDRAELQAWIKANLPKTAVLAQDGRADLPVERRTERLSVQGLLEQKVLDTKQLTDLGPLDQLTQKGVTHVVASESDYGKYFRKAWVPHNAKETQNRQFYLDLFAKGKLLFERPRATVIYLHPGLQLYAL